MTRTAPGFIKSNPQLTRSGELKHLLSTEGLPRVIVNHLLDTAQQYLSATQHEVKVKLNTPPLLQGKTVCHLFADDTTRSRPAFEVAARQLSAEVVNFDFRFSSTGPGESLRATLAGMQALQADLVVIRHTESGAPYLLARHCPPHVHVINAGDGRYADPVQALLDMLMIRHYKPDIRGLTVALVGDILHSRVARSDIHALTTLGAPEIRVIGPRTLLPDGPEQLGVQVFHEMDPGLRGADVIIVLGLPSERLNDACLPSTREYLNSYGLTPARLALAAPDALVLYAGPIKGCIEIEQSVVDGMRAVTLNQQTFGLAVRMAVMGIVAGAR